MTCLKYSRAVSHFFLFSASLPCRTGTCRARWCPAAPGAARVAAHAAQAAGQQRQHQQRASATDSRQHDVSEMTIASSDHSVPVSHAYSAARPCFEPDGRREAEIGARQRRVGDRCAACRPSARLRARSSSGWPATCSIMLEHLVDRHARPAANVVRRGPARPVSPAGDRRRRRRRRRT